MYAVSSPFKGQPHAMLHRWRQNPDLVHCHQIALTFLFLRVRSSSFEGGMPISNSFISGVFRALAHLGEGPHYCIT